ncbi:MAG: macro domain-containing protein [Planctomycetota bacterium]
MIRNIRALIQSELVAVGTVWLILEIYYGLINTETTARVGFWVFLIISLVLGVMWFLADGFLFAGYLKRSIEIQSNAFDTTVKVLFADVFFQDGVKVISVNEFFDSVVDGNHVSGISLHGNMLKNFWGGNVNDWDKQVTEELKNIKPIEVLSNRLAPGKPNKYAIGTTIKATINNNNFLCVALTHTNINTLQSSANSDDLNKALRELLAKARITCSGHALNIPLIGSGLARTGIKANIIVNLILLAIVEESKKQKITGEIRIILPKNMSNKIDLTTIWKDWG